MSQCGETMYTPADTYFVIVSRNESMAAFVSQDWIRITRWTPKASCWLVADAWMCSAGGKRRWRHKERTVKE
jgi:hypothetical protein